MTRISSTIRILLIIAAVGCAASAWAGAPAGHVDESPAALAERAHETILPTKASGDPVDFLAALAAGGEYLRHSQADITEDNAGNGTDGVDEDPDDPDDGGWDWRLTDPAFTHSTGASSTNLFGATAQGLLMAYMASGDAALGVALDDAVTAMLADPTIDSGADLAFLMNYNDLPGVTGTVAMDAARAKYDAKAVEYGTIIDYVEFIREYRGVTNGYPNGIVAWDIGIWAVNAAMLDARYPGNGYGADADAIAEVLYEDSFMDSPGYFDIIDDQGFDPTYADYNYYWYNLGITGLIDAFRAADWHTEEIPGLVDILLEGQASDGSVSYCYGANADDGDWQSTAYAVLTLAALDQATYQDEINRMCYWLAAWQDPTSGGWVYSSTGNHYPEIGGESTAALYYGEAPTDVIVDDDFLGQAEVDAYNLANGTAYVFGYDAFATVQAGIDAVSGSTVTVMAGLYVEQLHITTDDLVLTGAGAGATVIQSPVTLTEFFVTGTNNNFPVVFVDGATGVQISGLTIDGAMQGDTNYRFTGLAFWNGGGSATDIEVLNVMNSTFSGAQHGVGVYAYNDTGGPYTVALENVVVDEFQKTAVALSGAGLTVDLDNVTAIGAGPTDVTAQNGIQIGYGAGGTIDDCTVGDLYWTGEQWTASGVMAYLGDVTATNVDMDGCQTSFYWDNSNGALDGCTVTNPYGDAGYIYSDGAKGTAPRRQASPFVEEGFVPNTKAAVDVSITGGTFTGAGAADSWGPTAYGYGPATFELTDCEVTGWDWGVVCYDFGGAVIDATLTGNSIHGNTSYGFFTNATTTAAASCNWWGDAGGPDVALFNPNPAADALEGDAVYWPWLDAAGGNCTGYGDNNVSAGDAVECLTPDITCVEIPVSFNRLDTTASRGVSVTFELSSELVLCTANPNVDIVVASGTGTWVDGYTNAMYQIVDNGGGSYTVDHAVLGTPCGPTGGGDLFTVHVAKAAGLVSDAVGTLTVTDVLVRDCDNATLPGIPGAPGYVTIDLTNPAVLTDLAAAQFKTGNDTDGTTRIELTWSDPGGDTDVIDIYRKGYGDYPEYDDGTGAPAAAPVTIANGWAHVATVSAAAGVHIDEPATRDFWYYAATVTDACGNTGDACAITGGTLNYHLGDVSDGVTLGQGNNAVFTEDISHLGANYGNTLVYGDAINYLDVGPTADYGVDALPTTDDRIQFEDLMIFAMNYNLVAKLTPPAASGLNELVLLHAEPGEIGTTMVVELMLRADGDIQGLSVPLTWDRDVVEVVNMTPGDLLDRQGGPSLVLSPEAGVVDAAIFGLRSSAISGEGRLATWTFKVTGAGDPGFAIGDVDARDAANRSVDVMVSFNSSAPDALPAVSRLNAAMPNPFNPSTRLSFVLAREGRAKLGIYTLRGQLVTTLVDAELSAGPQVRYWDGTDQSSRSVSSGTYLVRLVAPDLVQSRTITLVK